MNFSTIRARLQHMADALKTSETVNPLGTEEWKEMHTIMSTALAAYPEAHNAFTEVLDRVTAQKHLTWELLKYAITQALNPYIDARVATAQALVDAGKG